VIPDKLYFRIGEVAKLCSVQTYVLRFWESEFPQLKPTKSGTGQRLYRKRDVEMALKIRNLLYEEGYTIPGARQAFQLEAKSAASANAKTQSELPLDAGAGRTSALKVQRLKTELREILGMLSRPVGKPRLVSKPRATETKPQLFD
jgi:DNA-binding transcriptional MerR regulator